MKNAVNPPSSPVLEKTGQGSPKAPFSDVNHNDIRKVYKAIGSFSKLKAYCGNGEFEKRMAKEEFLCLYKHLNRLHGLQDFDCYFSKASQKGSLGSLINEKKILPNVAKLYLSLNAFCQKPEQFTLTHCFPHLKQLELDGAERFTSLKSSLAQSFRVLSSLENLRLELSSSKTKRDDLFKALLELPQIVSFSLLNYSLTETSWKDLTSFIQRQKSLVSMKFEI